MTRPGHPVAALRVVAGEVVIGWLTAIDLSAVLGVRTDRARSRSSSNSTRRASVGYVRSDSGTARFARTKLRLQNVGLYETDAWLRSAVA
jgi:hypothetical protein